MAYPTLTLKAANAVFNGTGIEIIKHNLGHYQAFYNGKMLMENKTLASICPLVITALINQNL